VSWAEGRLWRSLRAICWIACGLMLDQGKFYGAGAMVATVALLGLVEQFERREQEDTARDVERWQAVGSALARPRSVPR
jgi:hypothetical protein